MSDFQPATPDQEDELDRLEREYGSPAGAEAARDTARRQIAERAHRQHTEIARRCAAMRTAWVELAALLHAFMEHRGWEILGYDSENAYLASPEIDLSPTHVRRLLRAYRSLVVERSVPPGALAGIELTKLDVTLPAIRSGEATVDQAIADTQELSRSDLQRHYRRGPNAPIDPDAEPPLVKCEACGRWGPAKDGGDP